MKFIFSFIALISINVQAADQEYSVTEVNSKKTRAIVGHTATLKAGDVLTFTDKFAETCRATVVTAEAATAVLDISKCSNAGNVSEKSVFKAAPQALLATYEDVKSAKPTTSKPTLDEDWYFLVGFGFSDVKYEDEVDDAMNAVEDLPDVDRSTVNFDLGFFWPLTDKKAMHGFMMSGIADSLDGPGGEMTISQYQYSYSYHRFFGENIGHGWFWRGDIGLAKYSIDIDTALIDDDESSDFGLGVLTGGGYGFAIGTETRLLLGGYVSLREAEDDKATAFSLTVSFLF